MNFRFSTYSIAFYIKSRIVDIIKFKSFMKTSATLCVLKKKREKSYLLFQRIVGYNNVNRRHVDIKFCPWVPLGVEFPCRNFECVASTFILNNPFNLSPQP